jgi:15-cis-phytoene synthase
MSPRGRGLDLHFEQHLIGGLPTLQRLALAYAPAANRLAWLGLLALDSRLAGIVRGAREPMLAQMRLAWWRDRLAEPADAWPRGDALLEALANWHGEHGALVPLVDGWEQLTAPPPLGEEAFAALAGSRGAAIAALARLVGAGEHAGEAMRGGHDWALTDLAGKLSDPAEQAAVSCLAASRDPRRLRLPRALRPLVVLHGLARRGNSGPVSTISVGVRLGLLGR